MTIKDAKELYFFYNANLGTMMRDGLYEDFLNMNLSQETLNNWKYELVQRYKKIINGSTAANAKMQTVFNFDEMNIDDSTNKKFLLGYYIMHKMELDVFSRILFCEMLCHQKYQRLLQEENYSLYEDLDDLLRIVRDGSYIIDASYQSDSYLDENDFAQENLLKRIECMKAQLSKKENKKQGFWSKIFKRRTTL